ncbi:MAG: hypothetical protein AB2L11_14095, partial [Syntrophobacteraceae bacterium]
MAGPEPHEFLISGCHRIFLAIGEHGNPTGRRISKNPAHKSFRLQIKAIAIIPCPEQGRTAVVDSTIVGRVWEDEAISRF